jgi:hypothetical protein
MNKIQQVNVQVKWGENLTEKWKHKKLLPQIGMWPESL